MITIRSTSGRNGEKLNDGNSKIDGNGKIKLNQESLKTLKSLIWETWLENRESMINTIRQVRLFLPYNVIINREVQQLKFWFLNNYLI